ncbi:zinc finger transcription factor 1 [Hypomontagnella monticulosa]|nr:zinc finger transcription factor 1 [Hypomontagnella monticulosa]
MDEARPNDYTRPRRTPQACNICRRRKTKCDGVRPRCRHCASKDIPCIWPSLPMSPDQERSSTSPTATTPSVSGVTTSPHEVALPSYTALKRSFDRFFKTHFASDFCSFDFRPDFEARYQEKPFLVVSIITLCAHYLTPEEALEDFGFNSGHETWCHYAPIARSLAKATSDEPTIPNTQGNLVLALSELLTKSGSRHWMYAGTAIRMAQIMRLNKEYHQNHSLRDQEIRRRVFWACLLMDRSLAYFLSKPRTLSLSNISIALPSTDISLAYQEQTRGITLDNLSSFEGYPSDIGLKPYFLKAVCLWSNLADIHVCHRRFRDSFPPIDPRSPMFKCSQAVREWSSSLARSLQWSVENYISQCGLGQGKIFVALHVLLRSALCVSHQSYLPQLDGSSVLLDIADAAGWSLMHRDPTLISTCVSNAMLVGELVLSVLDLAPGYHYDLQSIWVACSLLSVANTYLWLQYARDEQYIDQGIREKAVIYFDTISSLLASWTLKWKMAKVWATALQTMQATYRAAYLGEIPQNHKRADGSSSSDEETSRGYQPQPGDGYPSLINGASLYSYLRMITTDPAASTKDLRSVWIHLAVGWQQELGDSLIAEMAMQCNG